jgi:hypothetical protein
MSSGTKKQGVSNCVKNMLSYVRTGNPKQSVRWVVNENATGISRAVAFKIHKKAEQCS